MNVEMQVERLQFVSLFILIIQIMYNNITLLYRDKYTISCFLATVRDADAVILMFARLLK